MLGICAKHFRKIMSLKDHDNPLVTLVEGGAFMLFSVCLTPY